MNRGRRTTYNRNQSRFDFGPTSSGFAQTGFGEAENDFERFHREQREQREREDRERRERWDREQQERRRREEQFRRAYEQARAARQRATARRNPYEVLGIGCGATAAEIRKAWLALVKKHHPDVGGEPAEFREVQEAYEALRRA